MIDVINTVESPTSSIANNVGNGSTVHAIFLNLQVVLDIPGSGGINNIYMLVYKNPGNNVSNPAPDNVGVTDKRRFVLHQEMSMLGNGNVSPAEVNPKTLFKGVVMLPRTFKRNGIDDKLQVVIGHRTGETTQNTDWCLQCIYKEFR